MRKILYFALALASVAYIGFYCMFLFGWIPTSQNFMFIYQHGGIILAAAFAFVNFFGKGLKIGFLILLIVVVILYVLLSSGVLPIG